MKSTVAVVLGGGRGTRLFPLTKERAKPAVPLAGQYRLIDIPVSNCINSGINHIHVLTQFNSHSLNRHIAHTYKFDMFDGGYVEILAAEQTMDNANWFQGTADAVRQNLRHLHLATAKRVLILSGDQLYRMDFRKMIAFHEKTKAAVTIAAIPVRRDEAQSLGILNIDPHHWITRFEEKPKDEAVLDELAFDPASIRADGVEPGDRTHLASMGIYVFDTDVMLEMLKHEEWEDFGKQILPAAVQTGRVAARCFDGYWEDIGTIGAFYEANLDLTSPMPRFDFFDEEAPIYTHPRFLPPAKINSAQIDQTIIGDGCVIDQCAVTRSLIGVRAHIQQGSALNGVIIMGADFFETDADKRANRRAGRPDVGIGRGCRINRAIIDKNARIGEGVIIENGACLREHDGDGYFIRDGIVIVPRGGIIASGTVI
jgi:glucose-1-phosphate adenylyltransferase